MMIVRASPSRDDAGISPTTSGCEPVSWSSASPERRTKSRTHSPASRTCDSCIGSALTLGMRRNSESSLSQACSMSAESMQVPCASGRASGVTPAVLARQKPDVKQRGYVVETTSIGSSTFDRLAADFGGQLIRPDDPAFDEARTVFNGMIDRRPALIARPAGTADVIAAVAYAREEGLPIAVRCGGHSAAGHGTNDDGLVIDLSLMKGVRVDPARLVARANGGVNWGEYDRETQAFGLATPGGRATTTGVGGFTLGGGYGWISPKYGLTCDNLVSADVVTADGRLLTASESENEELFWGAPRRRRQLRRGHVVRVQGLPGRSDRVRGADGIPRRARGRSDRHLARPRRRGRPGRNRHGSGLADCAARGVRPRMAPGEAGRRHRRLLVRRRRGRRELSQAAQGPRAGGRPLRADPVPRPAGDARPHVSGRAAELLAGRAPGGAARPRHRGLRRARHPRGRPALVLAPVPARRAGRPHRRPRNGVQPPLRPVHDPHDRLLGGSAGGRAALRMGEGALRSDAAVCDRRRLSELHRRFD